MYRGRGVSTLCNLVLFLWKRKSDKFRKIENATSKEKYKKKQNKVYTCGR